MAKRYSEGEFLRKIRRALMGDGLERNIRLVDRPAYRASPSERLVEISATHPDGTRVIRHHNTALPGTPDCVERICAENRQHPGLTPATIDGILAGAGTAVMHGEGFAPIVVHYATDMPLMVMAGATLHDIAGRGHERTLALPSGDIAGWWRKHDDIQTLELGLDRARRGTGGKARALRIDGGLAHLLRTLPDGVERLERIIAALEAGIDHGGQADGHTPITIDAINMTVDGLPLAAGRRGIRLKDHKVGGASLTGTTLTVPRRLPETLLLAITGRRLDEVVDPPPLAGGIRITGASALQNATALRLDLRATSAADLRTELARGT